ncbi:hypothetical protein OSB04_003055 [Centaurea solstitialis]|uniref:Transferase n=1 Tax=Centaurea solstitialis TaxID=347529 RepID=A0AA38TUG0_9ASTR|nr:hypothetical protein OSB04_003055 [Centaurea solstitialis]
MLENKSQCIKTFHIKTFHIWNDPGWRIRANASRLSTSAGRRRTRRIQSDTLGPFGYLFQRGSRDVKESDTFAFAFDKLEESLDAFTFYFCLGDEVMGAGRLKKFSITAYLDELRRSLSATLTHFYPLAARLATRKQENPHSYVIYIDTQNISGVKFIYATVDVNISDILTSTYVPSVVHSFFDLNNVINHDGHTLPLLSIQVTELNDGIFIGCSINHLIADGTAFWYFMAAWSETFRSKEQGRCFKKPTIQGYYPIINLPFTHQDQFIARSGHPPRIERFFHFSTANILRLKAKANAECNTNKISSLQAVAALLWRCVTRVRRHSGESETICRLVINNRGRLNPPLVDDYFGNPIGMVRGRATVEDLMAHDLGWAALRLHEAVANHDSLIQIGFELYRRFLTISGNREKGLK